MADEPWAGTGDLPNEYEDLRTAARELEMALAA